MPSFCVTVRAAGLVLVQGGDREGVGMQEFGFLCACCAYTFVCGLVAYGLLALPKPMLVLFLGGDLPIGGALSQGDVGAQP